MQKSIFLVGMLMVTQCYSMSQKTKNPVVKDVVRHESEKFVSYSGTLKEQHNGVLKKKFITCIRHKNGDVEGSKHSRQRYYQSVPLRPVRAESLFATLESTYKRRQAEEIVYKVEREVGKDYIQYTKYLPYPAPSTIVSKQYTDGPRKGEVVSQRFIHRWGCLLNGSRTFSKLEKDYIRYVVWQKFEDSKKETSK